MARAPARPPAPPGPGNRRPESCPTCTRSWLRTQGNFQSQRRAPPTSSSPLRYEDLSFISITAVVGTPMDITVEELAIESFYPADAATAAALTAWQAEHRA